MSQQKNESFIKIREQGGRKKGGRKEGEKRKEGRRGLRWEVAKEGRMIKREAGCMRLF